MEVLALAIEADAFSSVPTGPTQAGASSRSAFLEAVAALRESDALEDASLGVFAVRLGLSERQVSVAPFWFRARDDLLYFHDTTRCGAAQRLLEASTLPVIQVAAETGWSSLAHFNSVFRRLTGRTPTAYRNIALRDQ